MIRIALAAASIALLAGSATATIRCRDPKTGRAMKSAQATAVKTTSTTTTSEQVTRDSEGKCHVASGKDKGRYTACPKP